MQGCTRVIYAFTCSFDRKSSPQRDAEEFKGRERRLARPRIILWRALGS